MILSMCLMDDEFQLGSDFFFFSRCWDFGDLDNNLRTYNDVNDDGGAVTDHW